MSVWRLLGDIALDVALGKYNYPPKAAPAKTPPRISYYKMLDVEAAEFAAAMKKRGFTVERPVNRDAIVVRSIKFPELTHTILGWDLYGLGMNQVVARIMDAVAIVNANCAALEQQTA